MNLYYGDFNSKQDVANSFNVSLDSNLNILYAEYSNEDYSGNATVIFEQNGKLFEVHGSHCSCYGLDGQWSPESCTVEDVIARAENGQFSYVNCSEIRRAVENWSATSHLGLDFNFDNLPDAHEIIDKLSLQKILENKEYFFNKDSVFKEIKKNISESIKQGVLNSSKNVEVKHALDINPILNNHISPEKINTLLLNEFKDIQQVLLDKNWETTLLIKDSNVVFNINIPSLDNTQKKSRTKRML